MTKYVTPATQTKAIEMSAKGKILGHLAVEIADILRGKNNPEFRPNIFVAQPVIISDAGQIIVTGRKLDQKMYYHHSGYLGNLKTISLRELLKSKPETVIRHAVRGMLPKNRLRDQWLAQLTFKRGE